MKYLLIVIAILVCSLSVLAQSKTKAVVFPENSKEFTVVFPSAPKIQDIFSGDVSGKKATLDIRDAGLKVEVMDFDARTMAGFERLDEKQIASAAVNHGIDNGFESVTVTTGRTNLGRFAKMQGYKTISGERMIFEAVFHYGKKQVFVIYVGAPSRLYPSTATMNFFNSVKVVP